MPINQPFETVRCPAGHKIAERIDGNVVSRHHNRACVNPEMIVCDCGAIWRPEPVPGAV